MAVANLTFNQKRLCLGIALGIDAICLANLELGWALFGPLDPKKVFIGSVVALVLIQHFVGPSLREVQEHRDAKRSA
jgi:hypothetical protein